MNRKQNKIRCIISALLLNLVVHNVCAYDAVIDGIYYNFSGSSATVTYKENYGSNYFSDYSGNITIPESIIWNEEIYSVTSIEKCALAIANNKVTIA